MDRATKLRRLNAFRRNKSFCSAVVLAQILKDIKDNGLPDLIDRHAMREARDFITMSSEGGYGPILRQVECRSIDGYPLILNVADPFATLTKAIEESSTFRAFLKTRLELHPPSPEHPWNIILYCDEVTPGNPLATMNLRKFQGVYWSFFEFGVSALSHEESWFTSLTEFSVRVNSVEGGMSYVFATVIKTFFQPDGFHMMDNGMHIDLGAHSRLFAKIGIVIQDGGAHKSVWQARGDGASRFCLLCKNLFTEKSSVVDGDGTNQLRCNEIKLDELVPTTSADLRTNARYLERMASVLPRSGDQFTSLQQALGLTYASRGILLDRTLDRLIQPTEVYMHDYMHCLFVDGVLNLLIYLVFEQFINQGFANVYDSFSMFLARWKFPARLQAAHVAEIFSDDRRDRHRAAKHIKCQASDLLTVLGVLCLYVQTVLQPLHIDDHACRAILSCIELAQMVVASSRVEVSPAVLLGVVHRFLAEFTVAFGFEFLTPKAHWLLHLPVALQRFGRLLNCFVLERKHRLPKRFATELKNTAHDASKSLLTEVVCQHLSQLVNFDFSTDVALVKGRPAPKTSRRLILNVLELDDAADLEVLTASTVRFNPLATCHQGDVVLLQTEEGISAGRIKLCCSVNGVCACILQRFSFLRRTPDTALVLWKVSDGLYECFEADAILAAVEFCMYPGDTVGTLLPLEYAHACGS